MTLELGNSSPVLVAADADLSWAASRCALGAFAFAGQACISVQRVYCTGRLFDEFVHLMIQAAQKLQLGDPILESTDIGPMISVEDACRIEKLIHQEMAQGAQRLMGGDRNGSCFPATVVTGVSNASPLVQKEAFAPVVVVVPCKNFDDCIEHANQTEFGLQVGIFTRDIDRILSSIPQLDFGGVVINDMPGFRADHMPYGGVKQSGIGREGVRFAMEEMTSIQTVAIRRMESPPDHG